MSVCAFSLGFNWEGQQIAPVGEFRSQERGTIIAGNILKVVEWIPGLNFITGPCRVISSAIALAIIYNMEKQELKECGGELSSEAKKELDALKLDFGLGIARGVVITFTGSLIAVVDITMSIVNKVLSDKAIARSLAADN